MMLELQSHRAGSQRMTNTITSRSENSSPKSSFTTKADYHDNYDYDDDDDSTSWKNTKSFSNRIERPPHSAQLQRTTSSRSRSPRRCKIDIDSGLILGSQRMEDSSAFSSPQHASCRLSEEMVRRMMDIYCHLAEPSGDPHSSPECPLSPSSHGALLSSTSLSSTTSSESSDSNPNSSSASMVMSLSEDPMGCDSSPDPYKAMGKLPWADIGPYGTAFEVPWLSVGKDQLGYVANALAEFRVLVKQLASVNPSEMSHDQKLSFWINLYNSLLMHVSVLHLKINLYACDFAITSSRMLPSSPRHLNSWGTFKFPCIPGDSVPC